MDEVMYEKLKAQQNPKIHYRLVEISSKGETNYNDALHYEFESRGELVVAGITNEITMPLFVLPLGSEKLKISGGITIEMKSFQIDPPSFAGILKVGDDIRLLFDWVVASRGISAQTQTELVPLILELPAPAFKGTPKDLILGPNVEPATGIPW